MSGGEETHRITRRAALRGAAVAGAASLVTPPGAIAGAGSVRSAGVFSRRVGTLAGESAVIAAPRPFGLVGVEWSDPARARIELRTRHGAGGAWGPWAAASVLGHDPDGRASRAGYFGEAIWTGASDHVQLRSTCAVRGVRLHFVAAPSGFSDGSGYPSPQAGSPARAAQGFPLAQPVLDAGPGQPAIIARSAWAQRHAPVGGGPYYGAVKLAFVHHSVTPNGYSAGEVPSVLMSIYAYHRYVRGFFDIAYNFAVDAYGRIWEARAGGIDLPVIGAQAGGYNEESTGMVVLGTFSDVVPSPAAIGALEHLLAWKLSLHGLPTTGRVTVKVAPYDAFYTPFPPGAHVSLPRVAGHRDGDLTSCPGDAFYARLPSIRPQVAKLAGSPARMTISTTAATTGVGGPATTGVGGPATTSAGVPFTVGAGAAVTVSGRLTDLASGSPLAGAPVELQEIASGAGQTIATLSTAADGSWSSTFTPAGNTLVRALHRPAPAAVSGVVQIAVAPVLTLTLNSQSPLIVSGTVSPARRTVTVDLYKVVQGGHRLLMASKRVPAGAGSFKARFKAPRPGRYVLIARTRAGARYAAGSSAPVSVTA